MGVLFINVNLDKVDAAVKLTRQDFVLSANKGSNRDELLANCEPIRGYAEQEPMILPRPAEPGKFYIHTRGPFRSLDLERDKELLSIWYYSCIELAHTNQCKDVQIPLISGDVYPDDEAVQIAYETCYKFLRLNETDMNVYILMDNSPAESNGENTQDKDEMIRKRMKFMDTSLYIKKNYCYEADDNESSEPNIPKENKLNSLNFEEDIYFPEISVTDNKNDAEDTSASKVILDEQDIDSPWLNNNHDFESNQPPKVKEKKSEVQVYFQISYAEPSLPDKDDIKVEETFREMLLRLMNEKDMTAPEIYTKACMDRKLFSKIQSSDEYQPRKYTVVRLALALDLSLDETDEFMNNAGFALSHGKIKDLVIEYCIKNDMRSVSAVNEILEEWGLTTI